MSERMDVLLIGGTGFIGSELARIFTEKGKGVVSIGRHSKIDHSGTVIVADTLDRVALDQVLPSADSVFILTGQNHKDFDEEKEVKMLQNIITVLNERLPKKVFYLSSVLVYGETAVPARESDAGKPLEKYSQFKYRAETILKETLDKKILLAVLRLGNVYGNPANRGFIHWLMQSIKNKQELTLNGDGLQERDYIFIDDVVNALMRLEEKLIQSDTINIASGKSESLKGIVEVMGEVIGEKIPFAVNHQSIIEVQRSQVDVSKLEGYYGIESSHDLRSGLEITLKRYSVIA